MRTSNRLSKKAFREMGITYCIITAIRHYSDTQLLCMTHRSASSYLVGIRGMEEVGKAILLLEGHDLVLPGGHKKRLTKFFEEIPSFSNINPVEWAESYVREANNARYVDIIDMGDGDKLWNFPVLKFKNERVVRYLLDGITHFKENLLTNEIIEEEYSKIDCMCEQCENPQSLMQSLGNLEEKDNLTIDENLIQKLMHEQSERLDVLYPCKKGYPPPGASLAGTDFSDKLKSSL